MSESEREREFVGSLHMLVFEGRGGGGGGEGEGEREREREIKAHAAINSYKTIDE